MTTPRPRKATTKKDVVAVKKANSAALLMEKQNEMARRALSMRKMGRSWWDIAESLQISENQASQLVSHAINQAAALVDEGMKRSLLAMEVERLDDLQAAIWADALGGDLKAVETTLKIIQARAKVLGLDNIQTTSVTNNTIVVAGTSEEYVAALKRVAAHQPMIGDVDGAA